MLFLPALCPLPSALSTQLLRCSVKQSPDVSSSRRSETLYLFSSVLQFLIFCSIVRNAFHSLMNEYPIDVFNASSVDYSIMDLLRVFFPACLVTTFWLFSCFVIHGDFKHCVQTQWRTALETRDSGVLFCQMLAFFQWWMKWSGLEFLSVSPRVSILW